MYDYVGEKSCTISYRKNHDSPTRFSLALVASLRIHLRVMAEGRIWIQDLQITNPAPQPLGHAHFSNENNFYNFIAVVEN